MMVYESPGVSALSPPSACKSMVLTPLTLARLPLSTSSVEPVGVKKNDNVPPFKLNPGPENPDSW